MKLKQAISLLLITSMLAGCNPPPPGAGQDTGGVSKQDIGTVAGGVGGALLGSMFGQGTGKVLAVAGGAILGGLAGSTLGKSLDNADAIKAQQATQNALENSQSGQTTQWKNPDSGHSGTITPEAPYQNADGTYCREFSQTITVGGKQQQAYGKACRQPDGSWKIIQ